VTVIGFQIAQYPKTTRRVTLTIMKVRDSVGLTPWLAEFADAHREAEFEAREERVQLPGLRIAVGIR